MDTAPWQHHQGLCTKELQGKEERERPGESSESSKSHAQLKGQLASTPGDTGLGGSAERGWSDEEGFLKAAALACSAASLLPGEWVHLSPQQLDGSPVPPCAHRENWSRSRAHRMGWPRGRRALSQEHALLPRPKLANHSFSPRTK